MNSINAKTSNNLNTGINQKPVESVETAGSLAFNTQKSWLAAPIYDSFTSSNPFTPDYSSYSGSEGGSVTVASTGFLASFNPASISPRFVVSSESGISVISHAILTSHSIVPAKAPRAGPIFRSIQSGEKAQTICAACASV